MILKIRKIIGEVLPAGRQVLDKFLVTASEKPEFGHYSTNAAFISGRDPNELAKEILLRHSADQNDGSGLFEKVEVKGKFINFWISKEALAKELAEILEAKKFRNLNLKKSKINLEF